MADNYLIRSIPLMFLRVCTPTEKVRFDFPVWKAIFFIFGLIQMFFVDFERTPQLKTTLGITNEESPLGISIGNRMTNLKRLSFFSTDTQSYYSIQQALIRIKFALNIIYYRPEIFTSSFSTSFPNFFFYPSHPDWQFPNWELS